MSRKKILTEKRYFRYFQSCLSFFVLFLYTWVLSIKHEVKMVGYRPSFVHVFIKEKAWSIKMQMKWRTRLIFGQLDLWGWTIFTVSVRAALADSRQSVDQSKQPSAGWLKAAGTMNICIWLFCKHDNLSPHKLVSWKSFISMLLVSC